MSDNFIYRNDIKIRPVPYKAWAFVCFLFFYACSTGPSEEEIRALARLRCEAVTLKDRRFALADSIRALEEKNPVAVEAIEKMQMRGQKLKEISLTLADSIQTKLDFYFTRKFNTREEKNKFLEQVEKQMQQMGCQ